MCWIWICHKISTNQIHPRSICNFLRTQRLWVSKIDAFSWSKKCSTLINVKSFIVSDCPWNFWDLWLQHTKMLVNVHSSNDSFSRVSKYFVIFFSAYTHTLFLSPSLCPSLNSMHGSALDASFRLFYACLHALNGPLSLLLVILKLIFFHNFLSFSISLSLFLSLECLHQLSIIL